MFCSLLAVCCVAAVGEPVARAHEVHTDRIYRLAVGFPTAPAPLEGVDVHNRRVCNKLPERPKRLWRWKASTDRVRHSPVVDDDGRVLFASNLGNVVQLSSEGKLQWRTRLGSARAIVSPVLLSSGVRVVLDARLRLWGIDPRGHVVFRRSLVKSSVGGVTRLSSTVAMLPTARDSVVVVTKTLMYEVDSDGTVAAEVTLPSDVVGNLAWTERGVLAVSQRRRWLSWRQPLGMSSLQTAASIVPSRGFVYLGQGNVLGVDERGFPTTYQLDGGISHSVLSAWTTRRVPSVAHDGTFAFVASDSASVVWVTAAEKVDGVRVIPKTSLDVEAIGASSASRLERVWLMDEEHRVMVAQKRGRVGVVREDGTVNWSAQRSCHGVKWMVPAGNERVVVACENGALVEYGPGR